MSVQQPWRGKRKPKTIDMNEVVMRGAYVPARLLKVSNAKAFPPRPHEHPTSLYFDFLSIQDPGSGIQDPVTMFSNLIHQSSHAHTHGRRTV